MINILKEIGWRVTNLKPSRSFGIANEGEPGFMNSMNIPVEIAPKINWKLSPLFNYLGTNRNLQI